MAEDKEQIIATILTPLSDTDSLPAQSPRLTDEEINQYDQMAESLAKKYSVSKVHPVVMIDPGTLKRYVCYLKEPLYMTKIRVMDKASALGAYTAAEELRQLCLLPHESDPITYSESPESDRFKIGVCDYALTMVRRVQNQFKKK